MAFVHFLDVHATLGTSDLNECEHDSWQIVSGRLLFGAGIECPPLDVYVE